MIFLFHICLHIWGSRFLTKCRFYKFWAIISPKFSLSRIYCRFYFFRTLLVLIFNQKCGPNLQSIIILTKPPYYMYVKNTKVSMKLTTNQVFTPESWHVEHVRIHFLCRRKRLYNCTQYKVHCTIVHSVVQHVQSVLTVS